MYILDSLCISPQNTYDADFFNEAEEIFDENQYWAKEPKYKGMVPLNLLRRMSKSVRMGVGTGMPLIRNYNNIDGIIIGSANGSIKKSISFLNQIVEYNEGTLTPTDFVQSTSNSIAGTLALLGNVRGYNNTHVNNGISFESALLDAILLFQENNADRLLIGGVEEISQANYNVDYLRGIFKKNAVKSSEILSSKTEGTVSGEGASVFIVDRNISENANLQIVDVEQLCFPSKNDIADLTKNMLNRHQLDFNDIDTLFLGYNGDVRTDLYYNQFKSNFSGAREICFKHLVGDYYTVSSFALWLAGKYCSGSKLHKSCILNDSNRELKNILIYNHYEGTQHGLILLQKV